MKAVTIVRETTGTTGEASYRAIVNGGDVHSVGRTAGEALDALTAQLGEDGPDMLLVMPAMRPDAFFTEAQISRLQELMQRVQAAGRPPEDVLSKDEYAELEALIEAEIVASGQRAAALADALGR